MTCEGHSIGSMLKVVKTDADDIELACYEIKKDGALGCRVAFLSKMYACEDLWELYDGCVVKIVQMFQINSDSKWERGLYHHNYGYAVGEITEFANKKCSNNIN